MSYGVKIRPETLVSEIVRSRRGALVEQWQAVIRKEDPQSAEFIVGRMALDCTTRANLLSLLERPPVEEPTEEQLAPFVDLVHGTECALAHFHTATQALASAFEALLLNEADSAPREPETAAILVRRFLGRVFRRVLDRTATVYEHVAETGPQALSELDGEGRLVYANAATETLLGRKPVIGECLLEWLVGTDRDLVAEALRSAPNSDGITGEFELKHADGGTRSAWLSLRPLLVNGKPKGFYVTAADISFVGAREEVFLDRLGLGAVKLNSDLTITYANPAARAMIGGLDPLGHNVYDFFERSEEQAGALARRREGKAEVYPTWIVRPTDGRRIPVSVAGTPMLDGQGHYRGTLGIIRSLEIERATGAIQSFIDTERDATGLLSALARSIQDLIPFDGLTVSQYSKSCEHVSLWFSFTTGQPIETSRRWWPIPQGLKTLVFESYIVDDLDTFIRSFPHLAGDPSARKFQQQKFRSLLRIPIRQESRVIASLALLSREQGLYRQEHLDLLQSLPSAQAVRMAFACKTRADDQFRYSLFKAMARCGTDRDLARLLVNELAAHYEWSHVAVSKPNPAKGVFRLLAEASALDRPGIRPEAREAPLTAGVRGFVYQNGTAVNVADRDGDDRFRGSPPSWPCTQSELCVPVRWDGETQWILEAEDDRVDAFSQDEQEEIVAIVEEVQLILRRLSRNLLLESTLDSTSDAVLATDTEGIVLEANRAAGDLLECERSELLGPFDRIFASADAARQALGSSGGAPVEVEWLRKSGRKVPVLLSGTDLPGDFSRKVFIAKDLTVARRLESLASLQKLFREVAVQTHTPLAIAVAAVRRAADENPGSDLYPKILAQLKRMEISYKRLALSVECEDVFRRAQPQLLDLGVEFKRILDEFPEPEQKATRYEGPDELPYIAADPGQLAFALATILSYAARQCDWEEERVRVSAVQDANRVGLVFATQTPATQESPAEERRLAEARLDLALGETAIREFASRAGGHYAFESSPAGVAIRLEFPIARR